MSMVEGGDTSKVIRIPVPKTGTYIEMDTDKIALHVYEAMLIKGGQQFLSRGMTKVTKENYPDQEERQEKALEIAKANLQAIYAGTISVRGAAKEGKVPREVMKEARRMAREVARNWFKAQGYKVSLIKASKITEAANMLLTNDPKYIQDATEEVNRIAKKSVETPTGLDIDQLGDLEDPKKVKAAEARKASKTISAKQASKVATRARPSV
jgi:hypothetical protein